MSSPPWIRPLIAALFMLATLSPGPARAAPRGGNIYIVDRSDDVLGANFCTVLPNDCSLRGALLNANLNPYSTIVFSGTQDITLISPLNVTGAGTLIDGLGQLVTVRLSTTPTTDGNVFKISAEDVILRGLAIHGSSLGYANIWVTGASTKNVVLESNRIGVDVNGNCASPVSSDGIYVDATGTPGPGENLVTINQNLINCIVLGDGIEIYRADGVLVQENESSGNLLAGLRIESANRTRVLGNRIGIDNAGNALPNGTGIVVGNAVGTVIGGPGALGGNLISGNAGDGILLDAGARGATIVSNTIGTNRAMTASLNNLGNGIRIANGASGNRIGGSDPARRTEAARPADNIITGNSGHGILIEGASSVSNTIGGNQIGYVDQAGIPLEIRNLGDGVRIRDGSRENRIIAAGIIYNNHGVVIEDGEANSVLGSLIASNYSHGVALSGTVSQFNIITDVTLEDNGLDGLSERGNWTTYNANLWLPWRARGNGGLGIDRDAPDDALNEPTTVISGFMTTITGYTRTTGLVTGQGALLPLVNNFFVITPAIGVYGLTPADLDPSGYGEGAQLLGGTFVDAAGRWSYTLTPEERQQYACVTAIASLLQSSEFSRSVCRFDAFVPVVMR